jgi:hypothetical protein
MNNKLHFIILLFSFQTAFSQLNCKKTKGNENEEIVTCFHKNGKIASIEQWDKDKRFGSVKGFNNENKELFIFYTRTVGGHGSAHLSYYPNGQVSRVDYSSAPDGGIQWYKERLKFDENGNQIDKWVEEYPFKTVTTPYFHDSTNVKKEIQKQIKQEVIACAIPFLTVYQVRNTTNKKISIKLTPQKNLWVSLNEKNYLTTKNEFVTIDSVLQAERFLSPKEGYIVSLDLPEKQKRKYEILQLETLNESTKRTYQWVIIKND